MEYVRQLATEPQNMCLAAVLIGMIILITSLVLLVA
jgi:hypothetical protein